SKRDWSSDVCSSDLVVRDLGRALLAGQKGSSEITYDPLILGYTCSPRDRPNALFPSKRAPPVRKYRSRNLKMFCTKNPALITRRSEERRVGTVGNAR